MNIVHVAKKIKTDTFFISCLAARNDLNIKVYETNINAIRKGCYLMKNQKTLQYKITAIALACMLLCTGCSFQSRQAAEATVNTGMSAENSYKTSDNESADNAELVKNETVYVIANADGTAKKIIVSDWIANLLGASTVKDTSALDNVVNVKGDEGFTTDDELRIWNADGKDLYYSGSSQDALPVDLGVEYLLDGKAISAAELAGKSGKVTIRFTYKNKQSKKVSVNRKSETVYVPFVMLTGMVLDNECFSNVEVSNGKCINDGTRTAVIGFALPGMQESLGIDSNKLELPDTVEITADVKGFKLATTMTLATNEMFADFDTSKLDSIDNLNEQIDKMQSGMNKLLDGSSALYNGLTTLLERSDELISGMDKLSSGANELKTGSTALASGAVAMKDGIDTLSGGLSELTANNAALNDGAQTVFTSLLGIAQQQITAAGISIPQLTIDNYSGVLDGVLASLSTEKVRTLAEQTARRQVEAAVRAQTTTVQAQVSAGVQKSVLEAVLSAVGQSMTAEQYNAAAAAGQIPEAMQTQINGAVSQKMQSAEIQGQILSITETQIQALIMQNLQSEAVQQQINEALAEAASGAQSIEALRQQLDSYSAFYTGLQQYTDGVAKAASGSQQLKSAGAQLQNGAKSAADGASALADGIGKLKSGASALIDGVSKLQNGAMQLSDGLKQLNEEGVEKLVSAVGDINLLEKRIRAIMTASQEYKGFSGITDGMYGNVRFIYKTDSVGE